MTNENVQEKLKFIWGNSCYALCIAYINGLTDIKNMVYAVAAGILNGYIEEDCYVKEPVKYANLCKALMPRPLDLPQGGFKNVEKVDIKSLMDLPDDGLYAVEWKYGCGSHFAVCRRGEVVWDPSGDSNSVKYGTIHSYRRFS